eukprot:953655-Prymnesium_polylepis.1
MPWRSSKASPSWPAHTRCAGGGSCGTCARAGRRPSRPAVRRSASISRRVRDALCGGSRRTSRG